ncbi:flagellar protein FlaG [Pseudomonas sp. OIL-1]|uniref:flagellar protein FlaG n=1 Tax=Pseudomonas sp. OIL-1 TaxID=2706126 RepID=UPI0013A7AE79|nr:flagellar protein FlaG [Pseudomonas sp. OIL-1]QIB52810.1 flagellar protein FlaG [Pseudomonas sp. OIL-1]
MDMGTLKPLEINRSSISAAPVEAGLNSRTHNRSMETAQLKSAMLPVGTQSPTAVEQSAEIDRNALDSAVIDIQDFTQSVSRDIEFQLDDSTGQVVINVTERSSGTVIRQIPSEEALRLAENISEIRSLLFKAEA